MALTTAGKIQAMQGVFDSSVYIALFTAGDAELAGNGYSRSEVTTAQSVVNTTTGVVTFPMNHEVYTGTAQHATEGDRATQLAIYDQASGGNQLMEPEDITSPPAEPPIENQAFRVSVTINP